MSPTCPSANTQAIEQSSFWGPGNSNWDAHKIGWAVAGACSVVTVIVSIISVWNHCRNYTKPNEQRQTLRILYMPPVYAVVSFLSYRFFRSFDYYSLAEAAYEAVTLSAFLLLLIEFVAATASNHSAEKAMERKDKRKLPIPFCCWRYRPTKPYFMYTVKWAVLQYVIIRPVCSIVGIICQVYNVLCESGPLSFRFANVYLEIVDFVSISIALYGLLLFYGLTKEELRGRRPLAKFLAIKLIVMFTFYQGFVFDWLEGRVIHATKYWTETNIANGLSALTICIEMVFFSSFMMWAYTWKEYVVEGASKTSIWRPLWDSINYWDFVMEIAGSLRYFNSRRKTSRDTEKNKKMNFAEAFGLEESKTTSRDGSAVRSRVSYEDDIHLTPYPYSESRHADSTSPESPTF